ncbi:MAG: hypothetical protein N3B13_00275 [Deltaproteobacteria bacterium]|nr:hypothetical protein [Deltaproteobacteria bacterium]
MKRLPFVFTLFILILLFSCGEKPESVTEINPPEIKLSPEIEELIGDSARIIIYVNGRIVSKGLRNEIKEKKDFFVLNLPPGKQLVEVFITGPNENVIYALDRKIATVVPDIKNSIDIEIGPPLKFDTKVVNLAPGDEIIVTARIDASRLPEGLKNPPLKWTIDNIEGGNDELGLITTNGNSATIKGPSTLPSGQNHYLGAYYEADGKKFIAVIKINYTE